MCFTKRTLFQEDRAELSYCLDHTISEFIKDHPRRNDVKKDLNHATQFIMTIACLKKNYKRSFCLFILFARRPLNIWHCISSCTLGINFIRTICIEMSITLRIRKMRFIYFMGAKDFLLSLSWNFKFNINFLLIEYKKI